MNVIAKWNFNEGKGNETREEMSGLKHTIQYVFNNACYKPSSDPLWREGLQGKSLLFDGYSTWIDCGVGLLDNITQAFTIEAWIAPRFYAPDLDNRGLSIINSYDMEAKQGFILCLHSHGACSFAFGTGEHWVRLSPAGVAVPKGKWTHVAAVFDGRSGSAVLYLNGKEAASEVIPPNSSVPKSKTGLLIGKNNHPYMINECFTDNMFNGLIDELKIHGTALSAAEVSASCNNVLNLFPGGVLPEPDLEMDRNRYNGDRHRPKFHLTPPEHWMNEPHAPFFYNGQYHIFYQHNPLGPVFGNIHWGHAVSKDMVAWRDLPVALAPEKDAVDPIGCWSGSAVIDDEGVPVLFYTAGNDHTVPNQMAAIARSTVPEDGDNDLINWKKHTEPVVVQLEGQGMFGEFRDPFVWKEEDTWYMLVGTGVPEEGGTAVIYTSDDMYNWTYRGYFYVGNYAKYPKTGRMWELPVCLKLGKSEQGADKYVFIINPWYGEPSEFYCKYIWYWVGTFDKENCRFIPDEEEPELFVFGDHYTGPSGFIDPKGRVILFSIIQDWCSEEQHYKAGWAHTGGLPIELKLDKNNRVGVTPIEELKSLRREKLVSVTDKTPDEANAMLEGIEGDMLEIVAEIQPGNAMLYGLRLRCTPDGEEETVLYYDRETSRLNVDRNKSSLDPGTNKGIQGEFLDIGEGSLKLHIYVDHSVIEAFANELKGLATRVYPVKDDALGLQVWGNGSLIITNLEVWRLGPAYIS